ncbi:ABC transporter ATP-binding protein [Candidatus Pristimantibacillus sp. PTI5]|uniref:ABC transporter ATP-binding protein n=1 Tax=Candidatus Pristimantibacillus sp. PTI5 TaxID=3400422 RepID=UPI003B01425E
MKNQTKHATSNWRTYRWVIGYLKPYRMKMLLVICCAVVVSCGELVTPLLIQKLIDDIIPYNKKMAFFQLIGTLAAAFVVILLCNLIRNTLQNKVSVSAARDLQFNALKHLRKLGFAYYEQNPTGQTLSLLNQRVRSAERIFREFFPLIVQQTVFVIVAACIMLFQSPLLSAMIIPCFLIYYLFGPQLDRKLGELSRRMAEDRTAFEKKMYESVSGAKEYRAFGAEEWDIGRNSNFFRALTKTTLSWVYYAHVRWSLRSLLFKIGTMAVFVLGYYLIEQGNMSVGKFITFLLVSNMFMFRLSFLISVYIDQNMMLLEVSLLHDMVRKKPLLEGPLDPVKVDEIAGALSFHNVHFAYSGRDTVLKGVTLHIREGERVAIVGTSGNGKSTLLKLINRFYDPTEGLILLDGVPLSDLSFDVLRGAIGYVFQDTYLFGSSVRDNIRFGNPDATDEQVEAAAIAANIHAFISELSEGYNTIVGERGVKLSGGQKQRIAIARMLIKNPKIILLDEATSALDNVSEHVVSTALRNLFVGRTTIAVAHRLSTIIDYDRIVVLDGGVVAEQGSYQELMEQRGLFYSLVEGERCFKHDGGTASILVGGDSLEVY